MESNELFNRLNKISEVKYLRQQRNDFLETNYQYSSFLELYKTIKDMVNNFKISNLNFNVSIYDDENCGKDKCIAVNLENAIAFIHFYEYLKLRLGAVEEEYDINDDYEPINRELDEEKYIRFGGINITFGLPYENAIEENLQLNVDDNLNISWGNESHNELSTSILIWLIESVEKDYALEK